MDEFDFQKVTDQKLQLRIQQQLRLLISMVFPRVPTQTTLTLTCEVLLSGSCQGGLIGL